MADIGDTVAPKADQMINEDLIDGPRTFTISRVVVKSGADQPVDVYLEEFGNLPYRPSKSMRNVMIAGWGKESRTYAGKQLTLYRNPSTKFGRDIVGGIEISHLSDIPGAVDVMLRVKRGVRATFTVKPLRSAPTPTATDSRVAALRAEWETADPERRAAIEAEVKALNTTNRESA